MLHLYEISVHLTAFRAFIIDGPKNNGIKNNPFYGPFSLGERYCARNKTYSFRESFMLREDP